MKLVAVIVNHGSARFALPAARSVRAAWKRIGRPQDLDLVVVDQPSGKDEHACLRQLAQEGVRVVESPVNDGYAGGLARGLLGSTGSNEDLVLVLNPDMLLDERCLERLVDQLDQDDRAGVVGPRLWLDEGRSFQLPPPALPGGRVEFEDLLAARYPFFARRVARERSALAWEAWLTRNPIARPMLSGCCLLLRRGLLRQLGFFLDPAYPLYYEDADLCKRVHALGRTSVFVPSAEAVHFGARSSGVGRDFEQSARAKWQAARRLFLQRWSSRPARLVLGQADRWLARAPQALVGRPAHPLRDLGSFACAPTLELPLGGPWLVELSLAPTFGFSVGAVLPGGEQSLPTRTFDWLFEGRYFLRVLAPHNLRPFRWLSFHKEGAVSACPSPDLLHQAAAEDRSDRRALQEAARIDAPLRVREAPSRRAS